MGEFNSSRRHVALVVESGFGCRFEIPALRAAGFEVAGLVGSSTERTAERAYDHKGDNR